MGEILNILAGVMNFVAYWFSDKMALAMAGAKEITRGSQTFYGVPRLTTLWVALVAAILMIFAARLFASCARLLAGLRVQGEQPMKFLWSHPRALWVAEATPARWHAATH